ncbi:MAG: hypothetical protein IIC76_15645, partial [Bacteroidetes bacterium]|nr:hypothetical protein [Bacteroidota bacterium]
MIFPNLNKWVKKNSFLVFVLSMCFSGIFIWFMSLLIENKTNVKKFVNSAWQKVKENDGRMPLNIYGFPGGQTLLVKDGKYVPLMSVEGPGALVSHIEPSLEQIYAPIIQATKARLFE